LGRYDEASGRVTVISEEPPFEDALLLDHAAPRGGQAGGGTAGGGQAGGDWAGSGLCGGRLRLIECCDPDGTASRALYTTALREALMPVAWSCEWQSMESGALALGVATWLSPATNQLLCASDGLASGGGLEAVDMDPGAVTLLAPLLSDGDGDGDGTGDVVVASAAMRWLVANGAVGFVPTSSGGDEGGHAEAAGDRLPSLPSPPEVRSAARRVIPLSAAQPQAVVAAIRRHVF